MALESEAVFRERLDTLGLDAFCDQFVLAGWTTLGNFAYASAYTPGQPNDSKFITEVVQRLLDDVDHAKKAAVRRLYFEAYTAADTSFLCCAAELHPVQR